MCCPRQLSHHNITKLIGVTVLDDCLQVYVKYCHKESLAQVLQHEAVSLSWALRFVSVSNLTYTVFGIPVQRVCGVRLKVSH